MKVTTHNEAKKKNINTWIDTNTQTDNTKTTYIIPKLCKAQCDIARVLDLLLKRGFLIN